MSDEDFAGSLLENLELFNALIQCVEKAGAATVLSKHVMKSANHVCLSPLGVENTTRRIQPLELVVHQEVATRTGTVLKEPSIPTVNFDRRSITLVGGGAVQAYNFCLQDRLGFPFSSSKKTPDLDFVWWPTIVLPEYIGSLIKTKAVPADPTNPHFAILQSANPPFSFFHPKNTKEHPHPFYNSRHFAVVSSSPAIQTVVAEFSKNLEYQLNAFMQTYAEDILAIAYYIYKTSHVVLSVKTAIKNVFIAGICNIFGYIVVNIDGHEHEIQIIEFTIHDGASSQISTSLQSVLDDPVFSIHTFRSDTIHSCLTLQRDVVFQKPGGNKKSQLIFKVPILDRLLNQQFFALRKRYAEYQNPTSRISKKDLLAKIESHFRRCHFIYYGFLVQYLAKRFTEEGIASRPIFINAPALFEQYKELFENTEEWIASCTDPVLENCGIFRTNPIFQKLCHEGKMLEMKVCTAAQPMQSIPVSQPVLVNPTHSIPVYAATHPAMAHPSYPVYPQAYTGYPQHIYSAYSQAYPTYSTYGAYPLHTPYGGGKTRKVRRSRNRRR